MGRTNVLVNKQQEKLSFYTKAMTRNGKKISPSTCMFLLCQATIFIEEIILMGNILINLKTQADLD